MVTPSFESMEGILLWTDFWFKILLKFKASIPLFANFIFKNWRSRTLTAFNSLFEEMSKIILWSRCSGDAASAKCKVKVDSYKWCRMFKGREYSLVRIWWRPNCKLTNSRRPSKETLCISGLLYFLKPWLRRLLLVLSNRFKTFTDWHPGLVRFPMLSMWSFATIWGSSSQLSDPVFLPFPTKGSAYARGCLRDDISSREFGHS